MNATSKRRSYRIHLSTAIVLMIVIGALMYLNLSPKNETLFTANGRFSKYDRCRSIGWPLPAYRRFFGYGFSLRISENNSPSPAPADDREAATIHNFFDSEFPSSDAQHLLSGGLFADVAASVAVIAAVAFGLEFFLCRPVDSKP